jgi:hypothetical protein
LFSCIGSHSPVTEVNHPMHQFLICSFQIESLFTHVLYYLLILTITMPYICTHLLIVSFRIFRPFSVFLPLTAIFLLLKVTIPYFINSCVQYISCYLPLFYSKFISCSVFLYCIATLYCTKDFSTYVFICTIYLCLFYSESTSFFCFIVLYYLSILK